MYCIMKYMKSLSLTKPLVLVVIGLPGAGKSFFSTQFADTFHAPLLRSDYWHHLLYKDQTVTKASLQTVKTVLFAQLAEILKTQKTCVIDGLGATKLEREKIRTSAQKADYDILYIWVQTDKATAKYRSMTRSKRRKGDVFNPSLSSEEYDNFEKRFTLPANSENYLVVSGKHTYATQARIVLKKLVQPREQNTSQPSRGSDHHIPARNTIVIR